jgi:predicted transposase YbfD/YdcC
MLQSFLFKVKDHRRPQGQRYELGAVLFMSILAIVSGASSYRKISLFIVTHSKRLSELLDLEWKRMPAHTTIREILHKMDGASLESSFRQYSAELAGAQREKEAIAFDGKVLRGSLDRFQDQKARQLLSSFLTESQLILAHAEIARKSNEIPSARQLIEELGIEKALLTFDALHCQEETLQAAKATNNEVIVQVKGNQKTLLGDCQTIATTQTPSEVYQEPFTKAHGRIESRTVSLFPSPPLSAAFKWESVQTLIKVERHRQAFDTKSKTWKSTAETAFYLSSTLLSAQTFCHLIRNHWGIENRNHYVRDVTLGEDRSLIRINPFIFARLRSFALNILRFNHVSNVSQALYQNALNLDLVLNYNGIF